MKDIENGSNFLLVTIGLSGIITWLVKLLRLEAKDVKVDPENPHSVNDLEDSKVNAAAILGLLASKPDAVVDVDDVGKVSFQDVVGRGGAIPLMINMLTSPIPAQSCNAAGTACATYPMIKACVWLL